MIFLLDLPPGQPWYSPIVGKEKVQFVIFSFLLFILTREEVSIYTNDLTIQYNQKTEVRWCTSMTDDFVDMCVTAGGIAFYVYRHALAAPRNGSCDVSSSQLTEFAFGMCIGCRRGECRVVNFVFCEGLQSVAVQNC